MSDREYIKAKLDSAGRTMMMLPAAGTKPRGYTSGWPEIVRDFADMIEAPKENSPTILRATMAQMDELDVVEGWLVALAVICNEKKMPYIAKTVGLASLRWPLSERRVFSWSKLGRKMQSSPTSVKRWYEEGIDLICSNINVQARTGEVRRNVVQLTPKK